jgi:hypothetical protein
LAEHIDDQAPVSHGAGTLDVDMDSEDAGVVGAASALFSGSAAEFAALALLTASTRVQLISPPASIEEMEIGIGSEGWGQDVLEREVSAGDAMELADEPQDAGLPQLNPGEWGPEGEQRGLGGDTLHGSLAPDGVRENKVCEEAHYRTSVIALLQGTDLQVLDGEPVATGELWRAIEARREYAEPLANGRSQTINMARALALRECGIASRDCAPIRGQSALHRHRCLEHGPPNIPPPLPASSTAMALARRAGTAVTAAGSLIQTSQGRMGWAGAGRWSPMRSIAHQTVRIGSVSALFSRR